MKDDQLEHLMLWAEAVTAKTQDVVAQLDALAAKHRNLVKKVKDLETVVLNMAGDSR